MTHAFTWADFYLICFAVGFCFSFLSFLLGGARTGHLHLPHFHAHGGGMHVHVGHAHVGHAHVGGAHGSAAGGPGSANAAHAHHGQGMSPFNIVSITAFLAWFGGTGYLLTRFSMIWVGFGLMLSVLAGLIGGAIVFVFMTRVLISREEYMDPADYEMPGVLGKVCVTIREGGTGEIIYSQMGTRRVCGARSDDGSAIAKGQEVVVTRYERGLAYVRLWSEMAGESDPAIDKSSTAP